MSKDKIHEYLGEIGAIAEDLPDRDHCDEIWDFLWKIQEEMKKTRLMIEQTEEIIEEKSEEEKTIEDPFKMDEVLRQR